MTLAKVSITKRKSARILRKYIGYSVFTPRVTKGVQTATFKRQEEGKTILSRHASDAPAVGNKSPPRIVGDEAIALTRSIQHSPGAVVLPRTHDLTPSHTEQPCPASHSGGAKCPEERFGYCQPRAVSHKFDHRLVLALGELG